MCARDCKCFLKWWILLNFAPHSSHVYGASPVWILWWLSLFCFVLNDLLQMSHAKFLIPWQEILWWCKTFLCLNLAPQLKHLFIKTDLLYKFNIVWYTFELTQIFFLHVTKYDLNIDFSLKTFFHKYHKNVAWFLDEFSYALWEWSYF